KRPYRIEGIAIVSADGMIADSGGIQPDTLKLEADQRFFHATLDAATVLLHGRNSAEGGPHMAERRRLILTRGVVGLSRDPQNANAIHWNPAGASLEQAWNAFGLSGGSIAVIGGTEPFGMFLEIGYDVFHLSRTSKATLPGGRPVFPGVPSQTPDALLKRHGLKPGTDRVLDDQTGLTLVTWLR
ncbi:MAG: dihydrofolate reductase, partial [Hyphomicrobiales bacterium]